MQMKHPHHASKALLKSAATSTSNPYHTSLILQALFQPLSPLLLQLEKAIHHIRYKSNPYKQSQLEYYFLPMNKENFRPKTSKPNKINHHTTLHTPQKPQKNGPQAMLSSRSEQHDHFMRLIIAANADYFQNKVRGAAKGRSQEARFKILGGTGQTIYRKDYLEKHPKYNKEEGINQKMNTGSIKNNNFFKTDNIQLSIMPHSNYQHQYKAHPYVAAQSCRRVKKRVDTNDEDQKTPGYFETQNKNDFLNWGGRSFVPSMKPYEKTAVTNLPLNASSVYQMDFQGKSLPPTPLYQRESSFPKFSKVSTMLKSSYSRQFGVKKGNGGELSCKPKHVNATLCKQFKGTTQYKREFLKNSSSSLQPERYRTLEQLQTLIIDL